MTGRAPLGVLGITGPALTGGGGAAGTTVTLATAISVPAVLGEKWSIRSAMGAVLHPAVRNSVSTAQHLMGPSPAR
jgi:hypothetical protein